MDGTGKPGDPKGRDTDPVGGKREGPVCGWDMETAVLMKKRLGRMKTRREIRGKY